MLAVLQHVKPTGLYSSDKGHWRMMKRSHSSELLASDCPEGGAVEVTAGLCHFLAFATALVVIFVSSLCHNNDQFTSRMFWKTAYV